MTAKELLIGPSKNWKSLQYVNLYRMSVALLAFLAAILLSGSLPFAQSDSSLFMRTSFLYLVVSLFAIQITRFRQPDFETQSSVFAFADIVFLTLLIHSSGGLGSGIGFFLLFAVAANSFILQKRMVIFIASLASLAALIQHSWPVLIRDIPMTREIASGYPQVGILGIGLFIIATLSHILAQRLQTTEALAEKHSVDLANLTHINELIIQHLQSGVIVCNANLQIQLANDKAREFLAYENKDNLTQLDLGVISKELRLSVDAWLNQPSNQDQKPIRSSMGKILLPRYVLLGSDKYSGILIFLDDAALLKQQAQQLKMSALARLTASMAHEIRNPLGAISNAAQLLAESIPEHSQDHRLVQIIEDHGHRMNTIIENITQLARRDRVSQSRVQLNSWVENFVVQYVHTYQIDLRTIKICGLKGIEVNVDSDQLYQVIVNLCQNGLRHSPPFSGEPVLTLETGLEDDQPYLDVMDTGPGVLPEDLDNIFDPFFTTAASGTGLGLYIARELCEGNGGGLDYITDKCDGACFRVRFARVIQ